MKIMKIARGVSIACIAAAGGCGFASDGTVPERVSCADCRIVMEPVLTIGDTTEAGSLDARPTTVRLDGTGRYWINLLDVFPMIYDPAAGALRDFGTRGEGPGEFTSPHVREALPGDSMLVSDRFVFHVVAPDLTIARSIPSSHFLDRLRVLDWPHRVLAATRDFRQQTRTVRTVIAAYDMAGDTVAVTDTILVTPATSGMGGEWASTIRSLGTPAADGHLWISDYNRYRLVHYSPAGVAQDSVTRRPSWFPGGEAMRMGGPGEPTSPHMIGNWIDDQGRLWTLAAEPRLDVPDDVWPELPEGVVEVRVAAMPANYELERTLIEVIDPVANRVIARHTFDGYIIDILPDNRVASFVETDTGIPVLTIHRLTLTGAN